MQFESETGQKFKERPNPEEIKNLIKKWGYLNIDGRQNFDLKDIDPKSPSRHWNFLVEQGDKKFIFRMVGDEKPVKGTEIENEFKILKYVADYNVGPKPYYFNNTDLKEPFLLEEFLDGKLFTQLDVEEQKAKLPDVVELLVRINSIPIAEEIRHYLQEINNYQQHFSKWQERLAEIKQDARHDPLRREIEVLLPDAEKKLKESEKYLESAPESFIFKSAHSGHCIKTSSGMRFLNWEEVGYGDPSYSLAVFLSSIKDHPDFDEVKEIMTESYAEKNKMIQGKDFRKLLNTRLFERLVSNTIWPVWMAAVQKRKLSEREVLVVEDRISEIKKAL